MLRYVIIFCVMLISIHSNSDLVLTIVYNLICTCCCSCGQEHITVHVRCQRCHDQCCSGHAASIWYSPADSITENRPASRSFLSAAHASLHPCPHQICKCLLILLLLLVHDQNSKKIFFTCLVMAE